jgi:hypothetical protein
MRRLSLSNDQIEHALDKDLIGSWDAALNPKSGASVRDTKLANLLGLPTEGPLPKFLLYTSTLPTGATAPLQ